MGKNHQNSQIETDFATWAENQQSKDRRARRRARRIEERRDRRNARATDYLDEEFDDIPYRR